MTAFLIVSFIMLLGAYGGWRVGRKMGYSKGYSKGYTRGKDEGYAKAAEDMQEEKNKMYKVLGSR